MILLLLLLDYGCLKIMTIYTDISITNRLINSTVDYNNPDHNLIYFEDWNSYQTGYYYKLTIIQSIQ